MRRIAIIFSIILLIAINGCGIYSFTGASIPAEAKTVSIQYFPNNSEMVVPSLSQTLTEKLQDYFTSQTTLTLVDRGGDLQIEGSITGYSTVPKAIQGNETAALNRLTIKVEAKFTNTFDETQNYQSTFSEYEDYPSSTGLSEVEQEYVPVIVDKIVESIFNKAVVNW